MKVLRSFEIKGFKDGNLVSLDEYCAVKSNLISLRTTIPEFQRQVSFLVCGYATAIRTNKLRRFEYWAEDVQFVENSTIIIYTVLESNLFVKINVNKATAPPYIFIVYECGLA